LDITYHYPPDLLGLLIDTIPCLCRSKDDVITFFRGAGVERVVLEDLADRVRKDRASIGKHEITRAVLTRLNDRGEGALRERREVLKRIVEFEDFSACWPNDRLKGQGLVAQVRKVVDVKDSFTRMKDERESERRAHREAAAAKARAVQEKKQQLQALKDELFALFGMKDAWSRGKKLESVLNRLFQASDILVREAFVVRGDESNQALEQIDGVVELDGSIYLVEVKWWNEPIGRKEISDHFTRVYFRGQMRGLFISATPYTEAALEVCKEALQKAPFVLCELEEVVRALEADMALADLFRRKVKAALLDKQPFLKVF
jgi:restriction system protein